MTSWTSPRLIAVALSFALVLTACGGSSDDSEAESTSSLQTSSTSTADSEEPEAEGPGIDNRTEEEIAIDQLDVMLVQLGTDDLIGTADCVVERLESEGIEIVGQGGPELVAALGCDPGIGTRLFSPESFDVGEAEGECIVAGLVDAATRVRLAEAEAFFGTPTPPDAVLQTISSDCGVSLEELDRGFG